MPVCWTLWIIAGPVDFEILEEWPTESDRGRAIAGFGGYTKWLGSVLGRANLGYTLVIAVDGDTVRIHFWVKKKSQNGREHPINLLLDARVAVHVAEVSVSFNNRLNRSYGTEAMCEGATHCVQSCVFVLSRARSARS